MWRFKYTLWKLINIQWSFFKFSKVYLNFCYFLSFCLNIPEPSRAFHVACVSKDILDSLGHFIHFCRFFSNILELCWREGMDCSRILKITDKMHKIVYIEALRSDSEFVCNIFYCSWSLPIICFNAWFLLYVVFCLPFT